MTAYVFSASKEAIASLTISECERLEPALVVSGPHAGKCYYDAALAERDPRTIELFTPLISDPKNEVELVELDMRDLTPPELL